MAKHQLWLQQALTPLVGKFDLLFFLVSLFWTESGVHFFHVAHQHLSPHKVHISVGYLHCCMQETSTR